MDKMKSSAATAAVKEPVAPAPQPEPDYVYSGEKNYEAPKPDPWTSGAATAAVEENK